VPHAAGAALGLADPAAEVCEEPEQQGDARERERHAEAHRLAPVRERGGDRRRGSRWVRRRDGLAGGGEAETSAAPATPLVGASRSVMARDGMSGSFV
jgi:hypothetical protein